MSSISVGSSIWRHLVLLFHFEDRICLCRADWTLTYYVAQTGLRVQSYLEIISTEPASPCHSQPSLNTSLYKQGPGRKWFRDLIGAVKEIVINQLILKGQPFGRVCGNGHHWGSNEPSGNMERAFLRLRESPSTRGTTDTKFHADPSFIYCHYHTILPIYFLSTFAC